MFTPLRVFWYLEVIPLTTNPMTVYDGITIT